VHLPQIETLPQFLKHPKGLHLPQIEALPRFEAPEGNVFFNLSMVLNLSTQVPQIEHHAQIENEGASI
jgi:hypothetical protein